MNKLSTDQRRALGALLIAVALHLCGMLMIDGYGSGFSLRAMLVLASLLALASVGQTLVIILGGIDMSIPFVIGFANVIAAQLYGDGMSFWLVCAIVLALALIIGALNGAISGGLAIHPLIVTLGMGTIIQGSVLLWTAGFPSGSAPQAVSEFVSIGGSAMGLSVPWLVPSLAVVIVAVTLLLARTPYGRRIYAVGSNPRAAVLALISPLGMWTLTFAVSAFFAAVTGILLLGFTGSAYAQVGEPYLFQTIAAVVIGGTALVGGRGSFMGTVAGALVLTELNTLLIGFGLKPSLVQAALGVVIIMLVSLYGRDPHVRTRI